MINTGKDGRPNG